MLIRPSKSPSSPAPSHTRSLPEPRPSAPRPAPRQTLRDRKKAATWRKILGAAREIFLEVGFAQACLEQVAARAGVAKGTVYRHVESKAELYVAVLSQELRSFDAEMAQIVSGCETSSEMIEALGEWYVDAFTKPGFHLVHWALDNQDLIGEVPQDAIASVQAHTRARLLRLEAILRQGIERGEFVDCDSWLIANLLWKMVDAFVEFAASPARRELANRSVPQAFREGVQLILRGLRRS
jgi:AcrR family transcriptional regulator